MLQARRVVSALSCWSGFGRSYVIRLAWWLVGWGWAGLALLVVAVLWGGSDVFIVDPVHSSVMLINPG